jgi:hypothetical protein
MSNHISYSSNKELEAYLKSLCDKTFSNTSNKGQLFNALVQAQPLTLLVGSDEPLKQNEFALFKRNAGQIQSFYSSLVEDGALTTVESSDMDNYHDLTITDAPDYIKKIKLTDERFVESLTYIVGLCFLVRNLVLTAKGETSELPKSHSWYEQHAKTIASLSELKTPTRSKLYNVQEEAYDKAIVAYQTTAIGCSEEEVKHIDTLNKVITDVQAKMDSGDYDNEATAIILELQQIQEKIKSSKITFDGYTYVESNGSHRKKVYFFLLHLLSNIKVNQVAINQEYKNKADDFDATLIAFNEQLRNTHNKILTLNEKIEYAATPSQKKNYKNEIIKVKADFLKSYAHMTNQLVKKLIDGLPKELLQDLI